MKGNSRKNFRYRNIKWETSLPPKMFTRPKIQLLSDGWKNNRIGENPFIIAFHERGEMKRKHLSKDREERLSFYGILLKIMFPFLKRAIQF